MVSGLLEKIRSRGYWKVIIRPTTFVERRIGSFADLHPLLQKTYVKIPNWRWEFPHLDNRTPLHKDSDWIGQESEWEQYLECWRFYQSGQFVSIKGFYEDWRDNSGRRPPPSEWNPGRSLEVEDTLLQFNEIFEFAARLAFTEAGDAQMRLEISAHNIKGRGLKLDIHRMGSSYLHLLEGFCQRIAIQD